MNNTKKSLKVLFIGESWHIHMIHSKGYDSFTSSKYEEGATWLLQCLKNSQVDVTYMPAHTVQIAFPEDVAQLEQYDAIVISDIGSNTFLLQNDTFYQLRIKPNALELIKEYVNTRVNDRVSSLVSDTARLAHYSADTREQLLTLADQVHHKLNHLEEKLHRVDQVQWAQLHLEQIFSWWSAGRYASFSPAGRCYVALEELRWGAFGDVIRQSETGQVNQLLDILRHKALTQMAQESGGSATVRLNTLDWLGGQGREQADNEWHDAINWLGDWCSEEQHPVIWSTTQAAEHLPVRMPRLCSAERLSESMVDEIFQKGAA
ncbi:TPA: diguanylate cyclase regulator RdcB family protein [Escherichia coli]